MFEDRRIEIHSADHCVQKCKHCSHAADIAKPKIYRSDDYSSLFEIMSNQGVNWGTITVVGGEPFLNPWLYQLLFMARQYTNKVEVMTNCYWLRSEKDIEKHHKSLQLLDMLTITLYEPIINRIGRKEYNRLINLIGRRYKNLNISYFWNGEPVKDFGVIKFYDNPRPIINEECVFRNCLQLMPQGYLMRCCCGRRVPHHKAHDFFDVDGHIDKKALASWLSEPMIDLCNYCSIATDGVIFEKWEDQIILREA
jgi:hypothetical protein